MQILIATHNPAKRDELAQVFATFLPDALTFVTLSDVGITDDVEETGTTFLENAILKAETYARLSGLPTIADDGGICIAALNGAPGVHSKRWMGRTARDEELIDYCLLQLKPYKSQKERSAYFEVVLAFCENPSATASHHNPFIHTASARVEGHIATRPYGTVVAGFPYRALMIVDAYDRYYDELTPEQHQAINHRYKAGEQLASAILAWYNRVSQT